VVAAASISKKDKNKWTHYTPNITHSTPAPSSKGYDAQPRRTKNSTSDAKAANGQDNHTTPVKTEGHATHTRRASVPSMFDAEPSQSGSHHRNQTRQHNGRGRM